MSSSEMISNFSVLDTASSKDNEAFTAMLGGTEFSPIVHGLEGSDFSGQTFPLAYVTNHNPEVSLSRNINPFSTFSTFTGQYDELVSDMNAEDGDKGNDFEDITEQEDTDDRLSLVEKTAQIRDCFYSDHPQQYLQHSSENPLITLNDISNYQSSVGWVEDESTNWHNFDPGVLPKLNTTFVPPVYGIEKDNCSVLDLVVNAINTEQSKLTDIDSVNGNDCLVSNGSEIFYGDKDAAANDHDDDETMCEEISEQSEDENTSLSIGNVSGKGLHSCDKCSATFSASGKYETHMKIVHGEERPYSCVVCEKRFCTRYKLEAHGKIHDPNRYNGEPEWECGLCRKQYHVRVSLYTHWKSAHPGIKPITIKRNVSKVSNKQLEHQGVGVKSIKSLNKLSKLQQLKRRLLHLKKSVLDTNTESHASSSLCNSPQDVGKPPLPDDLVFPSAHDEAPVTVVDFRGGQHSCSVCGKVFTLPFALRDHMLLHTGEKPHKCPYCEQRFRIKQTLTYHMQRRHRTKEDLRNILKLLKCRVCGKDDFFMFHELYNHRTKKHRNVPYEKEKEKTFGCGICLKPFFLREDAIVCALLAHDPTSLRKSLFKYKCPACPPDRLGYFKLAYVKQHWEQEHFGEEMPPKLKGINLADCLSKEQVLPFVRVNKLKAHEIRETGLPQETCFERPLYFDLTPFGPSSEEEHLMATIMVEVLQASCDSRASQTCTLCGEELNSRSNLQRHLTTVHISQDLLKQVWEEQENNLREPTAVEKGITKTAEVIKPSEDEVETIFQAVISKTKMVDIEPENIENIEDENTEEIPTFQCKFCTKTFYKRRALQFHEVRGHNNSKCEEPAKIKRRQVPVPPPLQSSSKDFTDDEEEANACTEETHTTSGYEEARVRINDVKAIKALLKYQTVSVVLQRITISTEKLVMTNNSGVCISKQKLKEDDNLQIFEELPCQRKGKPEVIKRNVKTELNTEMNKTPDKILMVATEDGEYSKTKADSVNYCIAVAAIDKMVCDSPPPNLKIGVPRMPSSSTVTRPKRSLLKKQERKDNSKDISRSAKIMLHHIADQNLIKVSLARITNHLRQQQQRQQK